MVSGGGDGGSSEGEAQGEVVASTTGRKLMDFIPIYIPTVEEGLLEEAPRERRFMDFLKARPSRDWFLQFGFAGGLPPFSFIRRSTGEGEGVSPSDPPPRGRRFRVLFVRKINWGGMVRYAKNWVKKPKHVALLVWLAAVAACLVLMLLLLSGGLNHSIPESSRRKKWLEIDNQILNALFTIMCLYEHPRLVHYLVLLVRWSEKDVAELRRVYSRKGVARPGERGHIAFVIALLHMTCLSQYALCGLYWGYTRFDRPDIGENLCLAVGVAAPVIAGVYIVYGPLGRKVAAQADEEPAAADTRQAEKLAARVLDRRVVVTRPEWVGGLFDCCDDRAVAYLSCFCTCCVFGWNMERLGFGNMYVHIVTFLLLVIAPVWIFGVAALNIDDSEIRWAVQGAGIVLSVFGLLYGGFWRIQMRKKFKLNPNGFCCGRPGLTDCFQWLLCWACSLAQEVRTGNFYDIEEDSFYQKGGIPSSLEEEGSTMTALRQLRGVGSWRLPSSSVLLESPARSYSCPPEIGAVVMTLPVGSGKVGDCYAGFSKEDAAGETNHGVMAPPVPPFIGR
ncbi:hypothetical protein Taro_027367 [Colocasia esculenta]|uniref:Uncharacterized protein n=1 Tax=Colocasia esculenta TaxID=4460 RepID=A0A843VEB8_COLES|nr:hypothetical protein [Colocasia esculenta]